MRRFLQFCILLLCPLQAVGTVAQSQPEWANQDLWCLQLQPQMTENYVRSILGEPADQEATSVAKIWYYHQCPTRVDGKVTDRPSRGIVRFRLIRTDLGTGEKLPSPYFALIDWREPDWDLVRIDIQAAQAKAEADAEAARKLEEAEQARIAAQLELEKQRVEHEKLLQQQKEEAERKAAQEAARRRAELERIEAEKAAKWLGVKKDHWYFGAGGFVLACILVIVFKRVGP